MPRKILIFAGVLCLFGGLFSGKSWSAPGIPLPVNDSSFWVGFDFYGGVATESMAGFTEIVATTNAGSTDISATDAATGVTLSILNGQASSADGDRGIRDRVGYNVNFNNYVAADDPYRTVYRDFIFNKINLNDTSGYDNSIRLNLDNLTAGQEYIIRIYGYDAGGNGNTFAAVFSGTDPGAYSASSASLLATYRNINASPSAAYVDVVQTANAAGEIDLVLGGISLGEGPFAFFNGLEIIEKQAMSQLMKVDIKLSGNTNVEKTFQPMYFGTGVQAQTFYSDSGIEVAIDSNNSDARARERTPYNFPASLPMSDLYRGLIHPTGGVVNMELTGLTPGQLYELVIYSCDPDSNNNTYSSWYLVDTDAGTETMFKSAQTNVQSAASADAHQFSVIFEAEAADMFIRGKTGSGVVTLNGFELHELAKSDTLVVDINSTENSNYRPVAARAVELLMDAAASTGTLSTSLSGKPVTITVDTVANGESRFRTGTAFGYSNSQQYYNDNGLDVSVAMMQDFAFGRGTNPLTLEIDGLIAGHEYELTIYSQDLSSNSGWTNWYLGDVPANLDEDIWFVSYYGDDAVNKAAAEGVDVSEYWSYTETFIAESEFLRISGIGAGGANTFAFLNGFALTDNGAAGGAVPEPATWVMLLLGAGMGVFALRRRKSITA